MRALAVNGGIPLRGEICVSGSKNAALPILFSTLIVEGTSVIKNLPDIGDVRCALAILKELGADVQRRGGKVTVNTDNAAYKKPDPSLVCSIRASTYLIGACLARFGICHLQAFGGCNFSKRPIDFHLKTAECMGAAVEDSLVKCSGLNASVIRLPKPSVGATVNALIMASSAFGVTELYGTAREPHVFALVDFLRSAGAEIIIDNDRIRVKGSKLKNGNITLIGDMIEAGTYLCAGIATDGDVTVKGASSSELLPFIEALSSAGASFDVSCGAVRAYGKITKPQDIICAPYPDFPTDLQPITAALFALKCGGRIKDTVFPERFGYLKELSAFGARYKLISDTAYIYEPKEIKCSSVASPDLRGGAACIIFALAAKGESIVKDLSLIERGYENITKKLRTLGADVKIKKL